MTLGNKTIYAGGVLLTITLFTCLASKLFEPTVYVVEASERPVSLHLNNPPMQLTGRKPKDHSGPMDTLNTSNIPEIFRTKEKVNNFL